MFDHKKCFKEGVPVCFLNNCCSITVPIHQLVDRGRFLLLHRIVLGF